MSEHQVEIPSEHVEHTKHLSRDVAVAVAIMAIIAASIGSLQETESAHALGLKNESVLLQTRASDQWAFFQAKSVKKNGYLIAAQQAKMAGQNDADFAAKVEKYANEENEVQAEAKKLETESHEKWELSSHHTHRQHTLTLALTLVHVGIAISSLALFTSRRIALHGALFLVAGGIGVAAFAFLA